MNVRFLGEICDITMGQAPEGLSYNQDGEGLPLISGAGDFVNGKVVAKKFTREPGKISQVGDIIIGIRASIGERVWSDRDYCLGRGVAGLRPRPGKLAPGYLWHYLGDQTADLAAKGRGSTFKQVNREDVASIPLPARLPTYDEQCRIAAILDKADGIRARRRAALALTDDLLRAAFHSVVGEGNAAYPDWPSVVIEDLAADIPSALRTGPFGSDLKHSEFTSEGVAVLGIDNAVKNRFAWDERRYVSIAKYEALKRYEVRPGDVIVTIMGTTGRSAVVPDDIPPAISTKHLATITPDRTRVDPHFLSFAIHSSPALKAQIVSAGKGAIMDGLNLAIIRNLHLRLPPLVVQQRFAAALNRTDGYAARIRAALGSGDTLYASLADRAFNGELQCA